MCIYRWACNNSALCIYKVCNIIPSFHMLTYIHTFYICYMYTKYIWVCMWLYSIFVYIWMCICRWAHENWVWSCIHITTVFMGICVHLIYNIHVYINAEDSSVLILCCSGSNTAQQGTVRQWAGRAWMTEQTNKWQEAVVVNTGGWENEALLLYGLALLLIHAAGMQLQTNRI